MIETAVFLRAIGPSLLSNRRAARRTRPTRLQAAAHATP
jgi:hypothetical protein